MGKFGSHRKYNRLCKEILLKRYEARIIGKKNCLVSFWLRNLVGLGRLVLMAS